jgi:hypothetical protein
MSLEIIKPSLFGLKHCNRDFTQQETWGKNQFNSSFPTALCAYLYARSFNNIYLRLDANLKIQHTEINTLDLYGIAPNSDNIFYAFESQFTPYNQFLIGSSPRVDLVTQQRDIGICLRGLEIKLTALPDNTTCELEEAEYGCEIVVRPDTVVYLACSLVKHWQAHSQFLQQIIGNVFDSIQDWTDAKEVLPCLLSMVNFLDRLSIHLLPYQQPFLMQPIWKTVGKSPRLAEDCLDVFVWSDLAFTRLFLDSTKLEINLDRNISRPMRSVIWLFKMLYDFCRQGQIDYRNIIDQLSFNTKNDKAFAVSGRLTNNYMRSEFLRHPRIKKYEIKDIILGGGQNLLSPERRFDAIIYNSPELFS